MIHSHGVLRFGVELLAVGTTGYFTATMWERRAEPTARPLLAVAVVTVIGAVAHAALGHATPVRRALVESVGNLASDPLWVGSSMLTIVLAGGFWFVFALRYTGRGGRLIPVVSGSIGMFWIALLGFALFGDVSPGPEAEVATAPELALFLGAFVMMVLTVVGALLVLTTSLRRNAVRVREGTALAGGAALLAFSSTVAFIITDPVTVPVMLSAATGLFALGVTRYPAFEAPPVARIAGRDRLIEEMDEPFVVVDTENRVRDLNPAAERYFDVDSDDVIGDPLDTVFPSAVDTAAVADDDDQVTVESPDGATLAVTANRITDIRDRSFGHLLVCRDVTDRRRRERRLGLLNQLLTGAVADRMEAIAESATDFEEADDTTSATEGEFARFGRAVNARTTGLLELVAQAREVERVLAADGVGSVDVLTAVRDVTADRGDEPTVELVVETDGPVTAAVDAAVLEAIVDILVTDAAEHCRDTMEVVVAEADDGPVVHVVDDRPEANGSEIPGDALTNSERPKSDSAVVVEMSRLAAQHVGGTVSVGRRETGERRVTVRLPPPNEGSDRDTARGSAGTWTGERELPQSETDPEFESGDSAGAGVAGSATGGDRGDRR